MTDKINNMFFLMGQLAGQLKLADCTLRDMRQLSEENEFTRETCNTIDNMAEVFASDMEFLMREMLRIDWGNSGNPQ